MLFAALIDEVTFSDSRNIWLKSVESARFLS
jgi:hypothetical protein